MHLKKLEQDFSVCKVENLSKVNLDSEFCFIGQTDEERAVVCVTTDVPCNVVEREDGWKAFRIEGTLDFSLVGILSKVSGVLAASKIGIFAISTYNTDYILTKSDNYDRAIEVLEQAGYQFI